jgi:hypothetical protein
MGTEDIGEWVVGWRLAEGRGHEEYKEVVVVVE